MEGTKLEKAKSVIKDYYRAARCGIYNTRNIALDPMFTLYKDEEITIDICPSWSYFEVFGLSYDEFKQLEEYYERLCER